MSHWTDRALCAKLADFDPDDYATARPVCAACPVRQECLDAAMEEERGLGQHHRGSIRGGLSPVERAARDKIVNLCPDCQAVPLKGTAHTCADCRALRKTRRQRAYDARRRAESAAYDADQARLAHNAYMRGERTPWVLTGERVYQRRRKMDERSRARRAVA